MGPAIGRGERGLVLPSWLVALSAAAVVLALVGFAVSGERDPEVAASDGAGRTATAPDPERRDPPDAGGGGTDGATDGATDGTKADRKDDRTAKPERRQPDNEPVERRTAYVEVYNNSGITGLAGETTAALQDMGWPVVATDNWYGEIPADTVYHPAGLTGQAELLADDLGVARILPSVAPMRFDRLTVILTGSG
jgi:hypothetical protein